MFSQKKKSIERFRSTKVNGATFKVMNRPKSVSAVNNLTCQEHLLTESSLSSEKGNSFLKEHYLFHKTFPFVRNIAA